MIDGTEICIKSGLEVSCEDWEEVEPIKEEVTSTEDTSLEDDELNGSWAELWIWHCEQGKNPWKIPWQGNNGWS